MTVATVATLSFDQFWRWLKKHQDCILQVSTSEMSIFDQDDFVWRLEEEDDRTLVAQVMRGKALIAEVVIEPRKVDFVHVSPEPESEGQHLFELVGGTGEPIAFCQFLLNHGFDEEGGGHRGQPSFAQ